MFLNFLLPAAPWLLLGLIGAWHYSATPRGAWNICRAMLLVAALCGGFGLLLPRIAWPWFHLLGISALLLLTCLTIGLIRHPITKPQP